jgi:DNA-binding NarL/FixJ family response regulator
MNYSIVIADDHVLIAKALTGIIENFTKYKVLYEVEHGKALIEKLKYGKNIPDIILLDINMPVMDGFETALWLKQYHPEILILTLSMQDDDRTLIKMIRSGAKGYILKNSHPTELEKALDSIVTKGYYYPDWATNKILLNVARDNDNKKNEKELSQREIEFLQYAATEMTYKQIAEKMFCSPRTVESYRDVLFEKLELKTRVGLVVYALKNGIIKV